MQSSYSDLRKASMSNFVLYNYFRSSASFRVRIGMYWKQLPFEYKAVHLLKDGGEQHQANYKVLNPAGEVPTLVHGSVVISQSLAILQYLDQVHPSAPLFSTQPQLRAHVWQFCESINCAQPLQNLKVMQYLESEMKVEKSAVQTWTRHWITSNLEVCEKVLKIHSGRYSFGDKVSAADLFLIPQLFVVKRFEIDCSPYPNIQKVQKNCEALKAFQEAHPFRQPDTPAELKLPH